MNRRKFIRSSALAAISTLAVQNKFLAHSLNLSFKKHLLIDLGSVRIQDVITVAEQTAMPQLLQLISSGKLILDTSVRAKSTNQLANLLANATQFELHLYDQSSGFYDIALVQASIDSVLNASQNLFVTIHQTEMAHYNVEAYRYLLSQADELISKNFMRLSQSGVQVHIYSSSGRNLEPDEYGGLHHHANDSNCAKTFYMYSNIIQKFT